MQQLLTTVLAAARRGRHRQRRRALGAIATLLALVLATTAGIAVTTTVAAAAATNSTCSFAHDGTGQFARTICWFDFSGYDARQATSRDGQDFTVTLPGNFTLSFTVTTSGGTVSPHTFPTWAGAYLGNNGHYTGVGGSPALYQSADGTRTTSTISNIVLRDPDGDVGQGFALVGADAESTDSSEYLQWHSDEPIHSLTQTPTGTGLGNACSGGFTGVGTTTVRCTGQGSTTKTGTAIVAADNPTYFTQTMQGGGLEGFAFGVQVSKLRLSKTVVNGFAGDDFALQVTDSGGVTVASADTAGGDTATTGEVTVLTTGSGSRYTLAETATSGRTGNYTQSWSCQRNGAPDTSIPASAGTSVSAVLTLGDFLDCTLTNTAKPTGLSIVKHAGPPTDTNDNGITDAGDTIPYTFTVTNTGRIDVHGVTVNDPTLGPVTCPRTTLAAGTSEHCGPVNYTVTAADAAAGNVHNSATASALVDGTPDTPVTSTPSTTDTPTQVADPSISLVKSADPLTLDHAGDQVRFTYVATNTGNVPLTDVAIFEGTFSGTGTPPSLECPDTTTLAVGAQLTCTATYILTQLDIDRHRLDNAATVTGTPPDGPDVTDDAQVTTPAPARPQLSLDKSADPTVVTAPGQQVTYSFRVTNTGNVTLHDVAVDDGAFSGSGALSAIDCPANPLAPGQQITCTATYDVTTRDVDAGDEITNTATAHGTAPGATTPTDSAPSTARVDVAAVPALTVVKTAHPTTVTHAGQHVTYSFTVTNTGGVTLNDVGITETSFGGAGTAPAATCPTTTLGAGDSTTCTADYTTVQADIDNGGFENTATAHGTAPGANTPTVSDPDSAAVTAPASPALTLVKSATPASVSSAGDVVTYRFLLTNTGNVTLSGVQVSDGAFSGAGTLGSVVCPTTTLTPGAQTTCTASYTATQDDLDAGADLVNTAAAAGYAPGASTPTPSGESTATVTVQDSPSLTVQKSASPTVVTDAGTPVTYSFLVTNTGNVTLHDVGVSETGFGGTGPTPTADCPDTTLAPGAHTTCTATYTLTQADIDAGGFENTATAHGTPDTSGTPIDSPPSGAEVASTDGPALTVAKSVAPGVASGPGTTVTYSFVVTNTGNKTLHDLGVSETGFSGSGATPVVTCPATTLAPDAHVTCTATYTVTRADADTGSVTDTATAHAVPAGQSDPIGATSNEAVVTIPPAPALSVDKSATPTDAASFVVGHQVSYTFVVTNTGNVTLTGVDVADTQFSGSGGAPAVSCPQAAASLPVGEQVTCTATYTITQADLDAGQITNTAVATGTPVTGGPEVTSPPSSAVIPADQSPAITLVKTATPTVVTQPGQDVTYTFVVTNTGNVTVHGVQVAERSTTGTGTVSPITCDETTLIPGARATCTASYTLTPADADAGGVTNVAGATALPPGGGARIAAPDAQAVVTVPALPALTVAKSADPGTVAKAGEQVTYSFHVTNTGNVTLRDITVDDTGFTGTGTAPAVSCPSAVLAAGDSLDCTATYTVTQADADAGKISNSAVAHGTPPDPDPNTPATPVDSPPAPPATVTVPPAPALSVTKSADPSTVTDAGEQVTYSFHVTNTGNVTLRDITVDEAEFSGTGAMSAITCADTTLAPSIGTTCTATYTLTQDDIDAGAVTNTAIAHGTPPGETTPIDSPESNRVTVTSTPQPALTVTKSADNTVVDGAGAKITYSFTVTNTGNVTLHDVAVDEGGFSGTGTVSPVSCPVTTLAPQAHTVCTATYTVTQDDADAGTVTNTATAHGTPPGSTTPVDSPESNRVVVQIPATPSLTVVKSVSPAMADGLVAGTTLTYSFVITNTGNVTLHDVAPVETDFTGSGTISPISCPAASATLGVGDQLTCTATYTVTQADVDAGRLSNTAVAEGTPPGSSGTPQRSGPSRVDVPAQPNPALTLTKTATPKAVSEAGETITYSFTITNTGNVTIRHAHPSEQAFSGSGSLPAPNCPAAADQLAPGATVVCALRYTVTQADVDTGTLTNTAVAGGQAPGGDTVTSPPSTARVSLDSHVHLVLTKTAMARDANHDGITDPGDSIDWSLTVTNTGTATARHVSVDDPTAGTVTCAASTLAPGERTTCAAPSHTITAADAHSGLVRNVATATSGTGDQDGVSASAQVRVQAAADPPSDGLAGTGVRAARTVGLGAVLLALGLLLALAGRRRRRS